MGRPVVEEGNNRVFKELVKESALHLVLVPVVCVLFSCPNGPAVFPVIGLNPPPIQDAQIYPAVGCHLHATCTTCLHGPSGGVQPDIHTLDKVSRHLYVVVFNKDDVVP